MRKKEAKFIRQVVENLMSPQGGIPVKKRYLGMGVMNIKEGRAFHNFLIL